MKYCIDYTTKKIKSNALKDFDEITINFRPSDTSLIEFMEQHQEQRINIYIQDPKDFVDNDRAKFFKAIKEKHPEINFVLKLPDYKAEFAYKTYEILKNSDVKIPYFFATQAKDFDTLWGLISLKPTDIYVTEILGFSIKQCAAAAHSENIQIRVYPNVAQSSWNGVHGVMKFWIRPEDVDTYEPYVDVMEFFGKEEKAPTYLRIYKQDKTWAGNLNEIILSLNYDIDSRCILSNFAERRLDCGKRCLQGGKCQTCAATLKLAQTLSDSKLTIKQLQRKPRAAKDSSVDLQEKNDIMYTENKEGAIKHGR